MLLWARRKICFNQFPTFKLDVKTFVNNQTSFYISVAFPKNTYASHRLTHKGFLEIYKRLLTQSGEIHQKTDNMHFFEFSIEQFTANGFRLKNVSLDLHNSGFEGNIMTEYETRFSQMGLPIYRLEAYQV